MSKILHSIFIFTFVFIGTHGLMHAQSTELQPIIQTIDSTVIPISVDSNEPQSLALLRRAFQAHGAFATTVPQSARFQIEVQVSGTTAALSISSSETEPYTRNVQGIDADHALLRAADIAVQKITGLPGFFAGQLTFVSDRNRHKEIYRSNLFFTKIYTVSNHGSISISPQWSPDAKKIAYTSYYKNGFPDLFLANLKTRQLQTLASFNGTNTGGAFSPYGSKIAMILSSNGNPELFISDINGQNMKRLTRNRSLETSPSWSPDGTKLVITSDSAGYPQIYEISSSGSQMRRLPTNISRYAAEPSWNPQEPELIAFTASSRKGYQLALYNRQTQRSQWLTAGGGDNIEAVWTNDGRHLVFTQRTGKTQRLHLMDTHSGKITALHNVQFGNSSQADFVYPPAQN